MNSECLYYYLAQETAFNSSCFIKFLDGLFNHFKADGLSSVTIIIDNVRFNHAEMVKKKIEDAGHRVLFLPAYSPFLNPIENLFNQLKFYVKQL